MKKITENKPRPLYKGASLVVKEQTPENNAILFQDHVERILAAADKGALSLPEDVRDASGKWVTIPDERNQDRKEMISDLIAHHTATYSRMSSHEHVEVYRVSGQIDFVNPKEVTATDWLRWLVRDEAFDNLKQRAAAEALNRIVRHPGEAVTVTAGRFVKAVRAASADPDHPHVTENRYFWRYASTRTMQNLLERFSRMVAPTPADRVGVNSAVMLHVRKLKGDLRYYPVMQDRPMCTEMQARGSLNYQSFTEFVELMAINVSENSVPPSLVMQRRPKRQGIAPVHGEDQLQPWSEEEPYLEKETWREETQDTLDRLTRALWNRNTSCEEFAQCVTDARILQTVLGSHGRDVSLTVTKKPRVPHYPANTTDGRKRSMAAIQNQVPSAPGQHGVPFRKSGGPRPYQASGTPKGLKDPAALPGTDQPVPPHPTAPREEIQSFIRKQLICFRHAFGISCQGCEYNHDLIPAGFYRGVRPMTQRPRRTEMRTQRVAAHQAVDPGAHKRVVPDTQEASINALTYVLGGPYPIAEEQESPKATGTGDTEDEEEDDYATLQPSKDSERGEEEEEQDSFPPRKPAVF